MDAALHDIAFVEVDACDVSVLWRAAITYKEKKRQSYLQLTCLAASMGGVERSCACPSCCAMQN